jgi:16S rRNA (adenine1518-N6/adenine1519-N6)-dimethyltransferase
MKIASKEYVIKRLTELMITPKKKYSQNFLTDYQTVVEAINSLSLKDDDVVIEVGPGLGALSQELLDRNVNLYAYEIDLNMYNHLIDVFAWSHTFHVDNIDFMKVDLKQFEGKTIKFISNVPYNITTPLIEKIVTSTLNVECFEFMVQKEVYDRIKAKVGSKDYSPLNIFIEYVGKLSVVKKVSKQNFIPVPNVDSIILKIDFTNKERLDKEIEKEFIRITKASFAMRRKTILNNLNAYFNSKETAQKVLFEAGIKENERAEDISLETYLKLAEITFSHK